MKVVYLAGRVNGPKHEAVRDLPAPFLCSDSDNHSEHGWGCAYYAFGSLAEQVQERCLGQIATADLLFAYLHDPLSYGAIAEIAYASAKGKKCVVAIYIARHAGEFLAMYDAYWLVCSLPGVTAHQVHSLDEARAIFAEALGIADYPRITGGLIQ
jgi:nucleoside 2-deoxyribosyltransferase